MEKEKNDKRRSFLKHLLTGTAAVLGTASVSKAVKANEAESQSDDREFLYLETEEFKKYYKSLRA